MAPVDGELECRPDREVRLQKLLSSAGYGGGAQLVEGSAQLVEPKTAEVTPSHGEAELPKTKASPRRQPRQFSARPPRPESASRKSAAVCADEAPQAGEEVDAADLVDEPPEAPPELSRTQELLESPCVPSVPSVEQPEEEASCLYDSDDELPCAPPEEAAMQEKQDLLPEQSLELLEASLLSAGSSSLSLSDSVGRRPNMSKAPAEGDEDLSPALAPGESAAQEELSAFLAASLASEGMASSLPEAPEEDCGCARPEARGAAEVEAQKEVASLPESMPAVKEISKIAKPQLPRAASRGQGSSVTFEPPLAVVGGGVPRKAATTRRPGSAGRAKPLPSAKALASGAAAERSRERASTRKDCNCRFCPSCRRRLHQENMRQAIARSLETISGESSQEPPIPSSNAHVRDGRDAARRPTPVAQPQRPRSSSANRTPVVRITASSSTERLRGHTKCSQARAESGGWRLRS